jgi:2-alkyl-3-oxoalkanoate reductase
MKIFVAGATGVIGHPSLAKLLEQENDLVALTRTSKKARILAEQGVEPIVDNVFDADTVKTAVIHARPEIVIE